MLCLRQRLWPTQVNCLWRQTQLYASFEDCQLSAAAVIRYVIRINSIHANIDTHISGTNKCLFVHRSVERVHSYVEESMCREESACVWVECGEMSQCIYKIISSKDEAYVDVVVAIN